MISSASMSGTGKADRFGAELEELAVAAALRTLVAEHRALVPQALRSVVGQVVLDHRAHGAGRAFGTQGQLVAVHRVGEGIHFLLDDVGDGADRAREQAGFLDDRGHQLLVAIAFQHGLDGVLEQFPQRRFGRQDVVHAFDGDDFFFFIGHIFALGRPGRRRDDTNHWAPACAGATFMLSQPLRP